MSNAAYAKAAQALQRKLQGTSGVPFIGRITKVNNDNESMEVEHFAGASSDLQVLHPYLGTNSHHRVGVDAGQMVLLQIRSGTKRPEASAYYQSQTNPRNTAAVKLENYKQRKSAYRPLEAGEQSLLSGGQAEIFLSRRAQLDTRAGFVRSWLDQDSIESGSRAATHVRQLHLHKIGELGDEERLGVVQRPA